MPNLRALNRRLVFFIRQSELAHQDPKNLDCPSRCNEESESNVDLDKKLQNIEIIPAVDSIEPGNRAIDGAHAVPNIVLTLSM
jgi:hypothetical protein